MAWTAGIRSRTWLAAVGAATLATALVPLRPAPVQARPSEAAGQDAVDAATFDRLSDGGRNSALDAGSTPTPRTARSGVPTAPGPTDRASLVNDPTTDGLNDTQASNDLTLARGNVVSAFSDSGSAAAGPHFTGYAVSSDGGSTFTDRGTLPNGPEGDGSNAKLATDTATGRVYLGTMSRTGQEVLQLWRSDDGGMTFGPPVTPTPGFEDTTAFQDTLSLAVDNFPGGPVAGQGNVYLAWKRFGGPPPGGAVELTRSTDGGDTWEPYRGVKVAPPAEAQGPAVVVAPDHSVLVFWWARPVSNGPGELQMARSTDQGLTFGPVTKVAQLRTFLPNGNVGLPFGFRTNGFPHATVNPVNGHVYVAYNDDPVGTDGSGVFLVVSSDLGATWSAPQKVESDTGTSDQWHPAVTVSPDGSRLFVAFSDNREDGYWIRRMGTIGRISGATVAFGHDFPLSPAFPPVVNQDPLVGRTYMGGYDGAVSDGEFFYTTWTDTRDPHLTHDFQPDIRFAKVPHDLDDSSADLGLTIEASTAGTTIQEDLTYTATVTNAGPGGAAFTSFTGLGPDSFMVTSAAPSQGSCTVATTGLVSCALGTVAAGAQATVTIRAEAGVLPGEHSFVGLAESLADDPSSGNDFARSTVDIALRPGTEPVTYTSGPVTGAIPGGRTVEFPIEVDPNAGVLDVAVRLRLTHTWDADLTLRLVAPDGTQVPLAMQRGGSGQDFGLGPADCSGTFTRFTDHAVVPVWQAAAPFAGSFRPEQPFSTLLGAPAGGTWRLRIEDALAEDAGALHCWELDLLRDTVNVPPPATTTSTSTTTSTTAPPTTTTSTSTTTTSTSTTTTLPPTTTTIAPPLPPTLQAPFSDWAQPAAAPLDGLGTWIATANDPAARAGQAAPAYLYAHLFGFSANPAAGAVALGTGPTGKFVLFTVREPGGRSHDVAAALPWSAGRFYFPLVHQISPGVWGAWVYDHSAATWTFVGQLALPAAWGKLAPTSTTGLLWYGATAASCAAYPLADVFFAPPTGFAAGTASTAAAGAQHGTTAGCPAVSTVEAGWARYRAGSGS